MTIDELKDKKILILGFGKEGRDNFRFLRKLFPKKVLGIADRLNFENLSPKAQNLIKSNRGRASIKLHLGENYLQVLKNYDVIIKSPGIPFKILPKSVLGKITSQTEIFLKNCPGKIVGITGTKGKSTTASLIYQILKQGGLKTHLVGNIGKPVLNLLLMAKPNHIYVYELSSHQLSNLKKSPQIAVFLNVYPEHLDYYRSLKEYIQAKANITLHQKKDDYLVFNSGDKLVKKIAKKSKAKKIPLQHIKCHLAQKENPLKGGFNLQNVKAAVGIGKIFKISDNDILKAIKNFKPLPHRLEFVGTYKGIKFYNDALSTIPETTIAALDALGDDVETIFLGGFDRKLNFKDLAKRILKSKIKNLIFLPTSGEKIWQEIKKFAPAHSHCRRPNLMRQKAGYWHTFFIDNMPDAVKLVYQYTQKGKICLLSCASTSFSVFKDYKEKGNLFKRYVRKFGSLH